MGLNLSKYTLARVVVFDITPLTARSLGHYGFIKVVYPYYGHAIVYVVESLCIVALWEILGYIDFERDTIHHVVLDDSLKVYAGNFVAHRVGVYSGTNVVKIVPAKWRGVDLQEGDEMVLQVESRRASSRKEYMVLVV